MAGLLFFKRVENMAGLLFWKEQKTWQIYCEKSGKHGSSTVLERVENMASLLPWKEW